MSVKHWGSLLASASLLAGCAATPPSSNSLDEALHTVQHSYAPDRRLTLFDVKIQDGQLVGEVENPEALTLLQSRLGKTIVEGVRLAPDEQTLTQTPYALVSTCVATLLARPAFAASTVTQAVHGTPLRVLTRARFWRVQTPDGYIGWVHPLQITPLSTERLEAWNRSPKLLVTSPSLILANDAQSVAARLTNGALVVYAGKSNGRERVQLADGRFGWLEKGTVRPLEKHLAQMQLTAERNPEEFYAQLLAYARTLVGVPYLWGGASPLGFDCSGFVSHVWRMAGFIVPRDADQMMRAGRSVPIDDRSAIAAGSHLFFGKVKEDGTFSVSHVGLSLGDGRFIHALGEVKIASLIPGEADYDAYNASRLIAARRIDPRIREGACFAAIPENGLYRVPVRAPEVCPQ